MHESILKQADDCSASGVVTQEGRKNPPSLGCAGFYSFASDISVIQNRPVAEVVLNLPDTVFHLDDIISRSIVEQFLYPDKSGIVEDRLRNTLYSTFCHAFRAVENGCFINGMEEILSFSLACSVGHRTISFNEDTQPVFDALFSAMDMIVLKLKEVDRDCLLRDHDTIYRQTARWAVSSLMHCKENKDSLNRSSLYQIILSGWDVLKDMPCTYSALASLILLQDSFSDNAPARCELFGLLKEASFS